ncbi:hypothetical protein BCV70DRAFT_200951 [Testicularia cyperi]|uniref:Uncharacterized protein n=1 Tax=Testicularia cyperi TaxID=1882483 RepID=A0A317XQ13_9BASI|nr:hypothetical protein BCV70DRAFT_200951 [Testicularia cyperi]
MCKFEADASRVAMRSCARGTMPHSRPSEAKKWYSIRRRLAVVAGTRFSSATKSLFWGGAPSTVILQTTVAYSSSSELDSFLAPPAVELGFPLLTNERTVSMQSEESLADLLRQTCCYTQRRAILPFVSTFEKHLKSRCRSCHHRCIQATVDSQSTTQQLRLFGGLQCVSAGDQMSCVALTPL